MGLDASAKRPAPNTGQLWELYDHAPCGFHALDEDGRFIWVNRRELEWLGYGSEEVCGRRFDEFLTEESADVFREAFARFKGDGLVHDLELDLVCRDDSVLHAIVNANAEYDAHGTYLSSRCSVVNISTRRRALSELGKVSAFLDSIVENIPYMIFVKGAPDLRFERINRAGEVLLGVSRAELLGKNDFDFFPEEQARFFHELDRQTLAAGEVVDVPEEPIETPQGRRWLHTKKIPIVGPDGEKTHLLGISEDITERREARLSLLREQDDLKEQLLHAQKLEAVGRLAGGVAHDFNNMLSVILSHAHFLRADAELGSQTYADAEAIHTAAGRAARITQQLLAFSRKQVMRPQVLDLNAVISEMNGLLLRLLGEDVSLSCVLPEGIGRVLVDRSQLEQVLVNLVVNARDAMPGGGKLSIETADVNLDHAYVASHPDASVGPHVMLAVTDGGFGMSAEVRARIFEPFFTTKQPGQGTGLGLSTVFGIVKQSGGNIWVYSEEGRGTTFKVYLPHHGGTPEPSGPSGPPAVLGGNETVLLAEDDELVRQSARAVLGRLGYTILEACDAQEAELLCRRYSGRIHLLLTDVVMPQVSGRQLAERLCALREDLRVLYMSGYTDNAIVHHGVLDPGINYLQKPFTPETLGQKVREVLDSRADGA